jgi:homoserine O-acetyltransferase
VRRSVTERQNILQQNFQRTTNGVSHIFMLKVGCCIIRKITAALASYKMMNQLLKTIDITRNRSSFENTIETVEAEIHIIAINSCFFTAVKTKPL